MPNCYVLLPSFARRGWEIVLQAHYERVSRMRPEYYRGAPIFRGTHQACWAEMERLGGMPEIETFGTSP